MKRVNGGQTTYYLYNGANCLLEYTADDGYKYYIYAGTQQIGEEKNAMKKYYHKDHLGSVRVLTDAAGTVILRKNYEPYGEEKPFFQDGFDTGSLANWTVTNPRGAGFTAQNGAVTITHSTTDYSGDYLMKRFEVLNSVIFEFRVKLGSVNNDGCSLAIESNALNLVFFGNSLYYYHGGWQLVGWVPLEEWNHYQIIVRTNRLEIYINDQLKYSLAGSFSAKSFLAFRDYGLCSGVVVNYLDDVRITSYDKEDYNFTSKKMDQDTGLVYFGARFYDPEIGRFITQDPAKDGANWYTYCRNNPVNMVDPDGCEPFSIAAAGLYFGSSALVSWYLVNAPAINQTLGRLFELAIKSAQAGLESAKKGAETGEKGSQSNSNDPNNSQDPNKGPKIKWKTAREFERDYGLKKGDFHDFKKQILKDLTSKDSPYKDAMKKVGNNPDIGVNEAGNICVKATNGSGNIVQTNIPTTSYVP